MWIKNNICIEIPALSKFAKTLKRDFDAVSNSLLYNYTNGLLEGQVNRLKTIKRMMYGRANFDLLRQRVLYQF
ncbi:transposase [Clostridium psychrophilum]|nr:transposase [Clostridium psychrophilum]